ncbi:cell division protein FtsL [Salisediminibacterium beveridgei]|uniref:Cell division protein FtsL n=1 Tax=Salisediminibacterium beveridgei TaxID=632773 RepID=A0A1D7QW89_9BACI|nr:cell division protein FtsL [Salisediminibacterium beveridgei]AOM83280.1 Protein FtsL [Salisediminibacterium beveridgei]
MSAVKNPRQTLVSPARQVEKHQVKERIYKGRFTKGEKLIYSFGVIAMTLVCFVLITNYALMYMSNHDIQQMEQQIVQQESAIDGLSLQVKELSDPDRILYIAQNDLGMTLSDDKVHVIHGYSSNASNE